MYRHHKDILIKMTDNMNTQTVLPGTDTPSTEPIGVEPVSMTSNPPPVSDLQDEKIDVPDSVTDPATDPADPASDLDDGLDATDDDIEPDVDSDLEVGDEHQDEHQEKYTDDIPDLIDDAGNVCEKYDPEVASLKPSVVAESVTVEFQSSATQGSETHVSETKEPSVFTWNGKRPFAGAVAQYETVLNSAIADAEQHLAENPKHAYAKVILPLFTTLHVDCVDQYGNTKVKKFAFHEAHYAPHIRTTNPRPSGKSASEQKWAGFLNRYVYIWTLLGQDGKAPGGDGTGRGGTACSPFRNAQVALLAKNLYLIDGSDVVFDEQTGNAWYNINIALYRSPPKNGPFRAAHGYGFIPYLGPARQPITQSVDAPVTEAKTEAVSHVEQEVSQEAPQEASQDIVQKERSDAKRPTRNGSEKRRAKKAAEQGADGSQTRGGGRGGRGAARGRGSAPGRGRGAARGAGRGARGGASKGTTQ